MIGKTERKIELTNLARASLEELLTDYRDFLRVHSMELWNKNSPKALAIRHLGRTSPQTFELYRPLVEGEPAETVANIGLCLLHQASFLLDRQTKQLEREFLQNGGLRERMTKARLTSHLPPEWCFGFLCRMNSQTSRDGTD